MRNTERSLFALAAYMRWRQKCKLHSPKFCSWRTFQHWTWIENGSHLLNTLTYSVAEKTENIAAGFCNQEGASQIVAKSTLHLCKSTSLRGILDNSVNAIVRLILCRQLEWSYQKNNLQMILVWRSLRGVDNSFPLEHNSSFNNLEKKKLEINMSAKLLCPPGAASPSIPIQLFKSGSWVSWVFSAALNPTRGNGCEVASWRVPLNTRLEHNNCPKQQLHKQRTKKHCLWHNGPEGWVDITNLNQKGSQWIEVQYIQWI